MAEVWIWVLIVVAALVVVGFSWWAAGKPQVWARGTNGSHLERRKGTDEDPPEAPPGAPKV